MIKSFFLSILILLLIVNIPSVFSADCLYTTQSISCNPAIEITRAYNPQGTIEYFSYYLATPSRVLIQMWPITQTAEGPDYDTFASWTYNSCPYTESYVDYSCLKNPPGAGYPEFCSRSSPLLPTGTYWVAVHHYDGGCTGSDCGYKLKITCVSTTSTTTTTTTTIPQYTITCEPGSPGHQCSSVKSVQNIEKITILTNPTTLKCGDQDVPVLIQWIGSHNNDKNYYGFFVDAGTSWFPIDNCTSQPQPSEQVTNNFTMSCFVDMPPPNTVVSDGRHKLNVTAETWGGYCEPTDSDVDAVLGATITLSNCYVTSTTTTSTTTIPRNYLEINGTSFIQPEGINITGWNDDLSKITYIYKNASSKNPDFLMQSGTDKQFSISSSSAWTAGGWKIFVNSTDNKTLEWRTFQVISTSTTTTTTIKPCTKCMQEAIGPCVIPPNNFDEPVGDRQYGYCQCLSDLERYSFQVECSSQQCKETLNPNMHTKMTLLPDTPTLDVDLLVNTDYAAQACPDPDPINCPATHNGPGQSEFCEWWINENFVSPQYVSVRRIDGTNPYSPTLGQGYRLYLEVKYDDPQPVPPGATLVESGVKYYGALEYGTTYSDYRYKIPITLAGQDVEIKVIPNSDAILNLYVSTNQNLIPFAEPAGTRDYVLSATGTTAGEEKSIILHNPQIGSYKVLVNHPDSPKSYGYGFIIQVKYVSQTTTTICWWCGGGGGGIRGRPLMIDLMNTLREIISRIFKI